FIGLPGNHTLYQVRYMFDNLRDVGLLFHNRDSCQMSGLNNEVNNGAIWSEIKNYEYHKMKGGHKVDDPGETKVFESAVKFVCDQFNHPVPLQKTWSHYDLCPDFSVWGYSVKSNKDKPGYLYLKNVDANGFGFYTTQWLPGGPAVKNCSANITTAPVYKPNASYYISSYNTGNNQLSMMKQSADKEGRLHFELEQGTEIGISPNGSPAGFSVIGYQLNENRKMIRADKTDGLVLNILNRNGDLAPNSKTKVTLACADPSVSIPSPTQILKSKKGQYLIHTNAFKIATSKKATSDGSPEYLRVKVYMEYGKESNENTIVIPVFYDVPAFNDVLVDDGRLMKSQYWDEENGDFKEVSYRRNNLGNGDGIAAPGEKFMLLKDNHRLRLYTDDPYVVANEEQIDDEVIPSVWPDGYTVSSIVKIAPDCPAGHVIEFIGHYETKTWFPIYRQVKWGKINITVHP
ncbi:MAG: hypothetical protein ACM3P1_03485, partial [Candidatus Saccharibacteria bacterium]